MATFVHLAPESATERTRRNGIAASRLGPGFDPARGVYCHPVQPDFVVTHQWLRELRRRSRERLCGIYFRIADTQTVHVGRFGTPHDKMSAAEAVGAVGSSGQLGLQVIVPRAIARTEIIRIKHLPQIVGWRVYPEAKGTTPVWPLPGSYGAARLRNAIDEIDEKERRNREHYYARFPADWYPDE